jgi:site-specific recombinase XerD
MDGKRGCTLGNVLRAGGEFIAAAEAKGYSPRTLQIYRQALNDFDCFLDLQGIRAAQDVTAAVIGAYRLRLQERKFSAAGEETYCRALKRFFDYLHARQEIFENPFAGADPLRRQKKLIPVPSEEEVAALLAAPDTSRPSGLRNRAILEVAYGTGVRLEELSRMRYPDLDHAAGTIRVMGKGRRERVVPLGKAALEWVSRYVAEVRAKWAKEGEDALWVGARGRRLHSCAISLMIRNYAAKLDVATHITAHGLRRACGTHLLKHGANPIHIQMLFGHASLHHLSQYLRVDFHELRAMHERSILGQ